jgi:hypothetical protein
MPWPWRQEGRESPALEHARKSWRERAHAEVFNGLLQVAVLPAAHDVPVVFQ